MIPTKLLLENFMAYTQAELDFRTIRIACLSGHNGAGKSTILDALTWALFDESRAHDSEDLIRLGASEMRVELHFGLEGQQYRVIRSRKRKGKGKSSGKATLEFQVQSENGFRSLSGKKISETQQRIESTLRMNYQLFVNSSFILQGRADAFTTATPAERKQVLADILQLDAYEKMRHMALELKRDLRAREALLREQSGRLEDELQAREHLEAHLADSRSHRQSLLAQLEQSREQAGRLEERSRQQREQELVLEHLRQNHAETLERRQQLTRQIEALNQQQGTLQRWLDQSDKIETGHQQLLTAETRLRESEADFAAYRQCEAHMQSLRQSSERDQHRIEMQLKEAEHACAGLSKELAGLDAVLADAARIEQGHQKWREALSQEGRLLQLQARWRELEQEQAQTRIQRDKAAQAAQWQQQSLSEQIASIQQRLQQLPALERERQQLQQQLEVLHLRQQRLEEVQTRGLELRHEQDNLEKEYARLNQALLANQQRQAELQAHKDSICPLCERLLTAADLDLLLAKYAGEYAAMEEERLALQPQIASLGSEIQRMRGQYQHLQRELKPRQDLLTRLGALDTSLATLKHEAERLEDLIEQRDQVTTTAREQAQAHEQTLARIERDLQDLGFAPAELSLVQAAIRDWQWAEARQRELAQARNDEPGLRGRLTLAQQQKAQSLRAMEEAKSRSASALAQAQSALEALAHVPALRQQLLQSVADHEPYRERYLKLQEARVRMESLLQQMSEQQADLNQTSQKMQGLENELRAQQALLAGSQDLARLKAEAAAHLDELQKQESALHAEIFSLEKDLETLVQRQAQREAHQKEISTLLYEIQLYEVLEDSFGKNGLQAVLIENALPEIEQIANDMLASMSEGRMHIKLQTLRSYKTRDKLAETLDILISDELGTRNYETFSAGEAFRVNFALRLAISKLLARRAGARLQTLVIDEGFGSQDAQGKTRLIEAINAVAADFALILVITHVDELKALFPCRVEVSKESGGSKLKVMHV